MSCCVVSSRVGSCTARAARGCERTRERKRTRQHVRVRLLRMCLLLLFGFSLLPLIPFNENASFQVRGRIPQRDGGVCELRARWQAYPRRRA